MEKNQSRITPVCAALNRGKAKYLVIGGVTCTWMATRARLTTSTS